MSVDELERVLEPVLTKYAATTVCIKGGWGVGKTYHWREIVKDNSDRILANRYSYVSLYGLNSIEDLKKALWENSQKVDDIGTSRLVAHYLNSAISIGRKIKPLETVAAGYDLVSFLSIRDALICIDDLERKGANLKSREILGLATYLRDERNCRVVFLLNDEALPDDDDSKDFKRFFEKSIERHIEFAPTAEINVKHAFSGGDEVDAVLSEFCVELGVNNIRVMQRMRRHGADTLAELASNHAEVRRAAVRMVGLLVWAEFGSGGPTIDFLLNHNRFRPTAVGDRSEAELRWLQQLERVGFYQFEDFDAALLKGVRRGFFLKGELSEYAARLDEQHQHKDMTAEVDQLWQQFRGQFGGDAEGFCISLRDAMKKATGHMSVSNLNSSVSLCRQLGFGNISGDIIADFVHNTNVSADWREALMPDAEVDLDLATKLDGKSADSIPDIRPEDGLRNVLTLNAWTEKDVKAASRLTEDEIYNFLRDFKCSFLRSAIAKMRSIDRPFPERLNGALRRIAAGNTLDRHRVAIYGSLGDAN